MSGFESRKIEGTELTFDVSDSASECDGCGKEVPAGVTMVGGIESCCGGGCARSICMDCVDAVVKGRTP